MSKVTSVETIDFESAKALYAEVIVIRKALDKLQKRILKLLPAKYGSKLWWKKGNLQAKKEVKQGKYYFLKSIDDLDNPPKRIYK